MHNGERDAIRIEGMGLSIGENATTQCPFCGGSSRNRESLSISRTDTGLLYNCYRASCPAKGFISSNPSEITKHVPQPKRKSRPYTKATTLLPEIVSQWLDKSFAISEDTTRAEGWRWNPDEQRIVMPIRDSYHHVIGHNSRYWSDLDAGNVGIGGGKSITYWNNPDVAKLHVPMATGISGNVVLVEDMPSAVRLAQDYNCIALLGTHLTAEMAATLAAMRYDNVIFALDADATAKALKLKNQWSFYFLRTTVLPLPGPDIKDMSILEYNEFLERLRKL